MALSILQIHKSIVVTNLIQFEPSSGKTNQIISCDYDNMIGLTFLFGS